MRTEKQHIVKVVSFLNNPDEDGGFWLPNIQRNFVWKEDQICKLFDSIMREYPISTLLVWKTNQKTYYRSFTQDHVAGSTSSDSPVVKSDSNKKYLVLDGQQRLQSLYIGLHGSYERKELYFDVLSGDVAEPDDEKYIFKFLDSSNAAFPFVKFKELISNLKKTRYKSDVINELLNRCTEDLSEDKTQQIERNLDIVSRTFLTVEGLSYQLLDSTDAPELYSEDDVVEIFIRANSGGTKLQKSDLLFALLATDWSDAGQQLEELLDKLNAPGYKYNRDFILKTCLVLLGHGARYDVQAFRKDELREAITNNWSDISKATLLVGDFVHSRTFMRSDKALPSYLALVPLIYLEYAFPGSLSSAAGLTDYLLRTSLSGAFSAQPDTIIDVVVRKIQEMKGFYLDEVLDAIKAKNRSVTVSEEQLWGYGYGSKHIHVIFSILYGPVNYDPAYDGNLPVIDHIFPRSILRGVKIESQTSKSGKVQKFPQAIQNQLANCMLLSRDENGGSGKSDTPPEVWFIDKNEEYLKKHLIPAERSLWVSSMFEEFVEERKRLIRERLEGLIG